MIRPQCRICKLRLEGGHGGYRTKSKKAIKLVILLKHLPYIERLRQLNLPTLKYRRLNAAARIVTAVAPGSMIKDCHIYCILSCTGWMFRSGSCISLLWSSTDVSRTRRRSICRTTVCQSLKLPVVSNSDLPLVISLYWSHDIVSEYSAVGLLLWLARRSGTHWQMNCELTLVIGLN